MRFSIDAELRAICADILAEGLDEAGWAAVEADDAFQTARYVGGFDADEGAFCFSYYAPDGREFWF